jgi:hypothetical protein
VNVHRRAGFEDDTVEVAYFKSCSAGRETPDNFFSGESASPHGTTFIRISPRICTHVVNIFKNKLGAEIGTTPGPKIRKGYKKNAPSAVNGEKHDLRELKTRQMKKIAFLCENLKFMD